MGKSRGADIIVDQPSYQFSFSFSFFDCVFFMCVSIFGFNQPDFTELSVENNNPFLARMTKESAEKSGVREQDAAANNGV